MKIIFASPKNFFWGKLDYLKLLAWRRREQNVFNMPGGTRLGRGLNLRFHLGKSDFEPGDFFKENSTFHPHFMYCLESHLTLLFLYPSIEVC